MASSVATLVKSLDKINAADFESDEAARVNAIAAAQKMIHRLQSGVERGIELTHQRSTVFPIIDVFEDLGLWEAWASQGHEISLEGLAQLSNTPLALNLLRTKSFTFLILSGKVISCRLTLRRRSLVSTVNCRRYF